MPNICLMSYNRMKLKVLAAQSQATGSVGTWENTESSLGQSVNVLVDVSVKMISSDASSEAQT